MNETDIEDNKKFTVVTLKETKKHIYSFPQAAFIAEIKGNLNSVTLILRMRHQTYLLVTIYTVAILLPQQISYKMPCCSDTHFSVNHIRFNLLISNLKVTEQMEKCKNNVIY